MIIPKHFQKDAEWLRANYSNLMRKYSDEWVAAYNGKIISHGRIKKNVELKAREKSRKEIIPVIFIECGNHVY